MGQLGYELALRISIPKRYIKPFDAGRSNEAFAIVMPKRQIFYLLSGLPDAPGY